GPFVSQLLKGQRAQRVVHLGQQFFRGNAIALFNPLKNPGDVAHAVHATPWERPLGVRTAQTFEGPREACKEAKPREIECERGVRRRLCAPKRAEWSFLSAEIAPRCAHKCRHKPLQTINLSYRNISPW